MRLTDSGNAERLIEMCGDIVLYCPPMRAWYIWNGRVWREDTNNSIYQLAKKVARSYLHDAEELDKDDYNRAKILRWAASSESLRGIQATVSLAQSNEEVYCGVDEFNRNPMLFNVENGTIDLSTGRFRLFDPADRITKYAPVTYVKGATCPIWDKFLADVLPDPDTREFIRVAVGYSLTASVDEDKMFILHGGGRNGKTTFVNTILGLMGAYGSQASSELIIRKRNSGPKDDLFVLMGKRFVAATETEESHRLDENLIKQMTGGNKISINPKYRSQLEFYPTWKLWLDTNYEPIITGTDNAIWSRIIKVPFQVTIPREKRDTGLKKYLMTDLSERSGILNWAIEGARKWNASGLRTSKEITELTAMYRTEQDLTGQFLSEVCHMCRGSVVSKDVLYSEYVGYCRRINETPKSKNAFGHDTLQRGIKETRTSNNRYWQDVSMDTSVSLLPCDAV